MMKKNDHVLINARHPPLFAVLSMVLFLLQACSTDRLSDTSGSETGNGKVTGCIVDSAGRRLSNAEVILLPKNYDPCKNNDSILRDTTNASGIYSFSCHFGKYTIQSMHLYNRKRSYCDNVNMETAELVLPDDTLKVPGSITITLPSNGDLQDGYFYIPGTTIYSFPDKNSGFAVLDSVPAACITAVCYAQKDNSQIRVIRNNVQVIAGSSVDILYPAWQYARPIYLNTTSSGALISESVTNFPILLRLTRKNFIFNQSDNHGSDILFTNLNGLPLPFEIERWDTGSGSAEIWVNVDTIRANSDSQQITMFWGNPSADNRSNGPIVFDTAKGFQGVWHLNEDRSKGADSIKDGTVNNSNGSWVGNEISAVDGVIGRALKFGGSTGGEESYVKLPNAANLDYHGSITISCWVRFNESSPDSFNIIGKYSFCEGNYGACIINGYSLFCKKQRSIQLRIGFGTSLFFYIESDIRITDTGWHYIVGMFHSGKMTLCIDDTRKDIDLPETPVPSLAAGFIGGKSFADGGYPFVGEIDEVRISNVLRTSSWITLNYLNQKSSDALVQWK
jgi:hypothetical protein